MQPVGAAPPGGWHRRTAIDYHRAMPIEPPHPLNILESLRAVVRDLRELAALEPENASIASSLEFALQSQASLEAAIKTRS